MQELRLLERRRWTRQEYDKAIALGVFQPGERLELIEGEIVRKVTQGSRHAAATGMTAEALRHGFATGYHVRVQMPIALGDSSEPEPDVAVVPGTFGDYVSAHPAEAVLIVEVSDTSLAVDRSKASLYARAGMAEYWIVNPADGLLEVHRDPAAMAEQPLGFHYRSVTRLTRAQAVSPLSAPTATLRVADLLPQG